MAKAFVIGQKENSTLISVKANEFMWGGRLAYIAKQEDWVVKETYDIPDGYIFTAMVIDGKPAMTDNEEQLYTLQW